ncbi:MAG: FlgD Ig-like domain [Verrucomicrobiota bacterium]|jgi:hypothetical protein
MMRIADCGLGKEAVAAVLGVILFAGSTSAQESPIPSPSPSPTEARSVRVSFVPPPLDGTISLGIYDAKGKLVRVLFREADINDLNIGHDSLSTTWDGKDDAGENVPPGKYSAHGFVVGDVKIEGVGFFFNDWITAPDSPRFSKITALRMRDDDLLLAVELVPPGGGHVLYEIANKTTKLSDTDPEPTASPQPSASVSGRNGTHWVIDRSGSNTMELKQFSSTGEFLRRLPISQGDPQPKAVAASTTQDKIYLLEENGTSQRVRGLSLAETKKESGEQTVSDWKVDFEKSIVAHKNFSLIDGKPVASGGSTETPDKIKVKLQPNPLLADNRVTIELSVGVDADGSFLKTIDGLPLCTISETQELIRGLLSARGVNAIDVFQDDGGVVEQFRLSGVDQMMSFDCGGFELK